MKIISIDLLNFRQYQNAHIDFSCNPERNVTIVMGNGGVGKTAFTQAFYWCFYGETSFDDKLLLNTDMAAKMCDGESMQTVVQINVEYGDKIYEIERTEWYEKNGDSVDCKYSKMNDRNELCIYMGLTHEKIVGYEAEQLVDRMLPSGLSRYFFFDGEKMQNMSDALFDSKSNNDIAMVIQRVVGLNSLQRLRGHLKLVDSTKKTVIRELNRSIDDAGSDELKRITSDIHSVEIEMAQKAVDISECKNTIEEVEEELKKIDAWLNNHESAVTIQQKIDELCEKKRLIMNERNHKEEEFSKILSSSREKRLLRWIVEFTKIQGISDDGEAISDYNVPVDLLENLLEKNMCICGCDLQVNSEHRKYLIKLLEEIKETGFSKSYKTFLRHYEQINREVEGNLLSEKNYMDAIDTYEERSVKLDEDIKKNQIDMSSRDDEISEKLELQQTYKTDSENANDRKNFLSSELIELEKRIQKLNISRDELIKKDDNNQFYRECLEMAEQVNEMIQQAYGTEESQIRELFKEHFQKMFDEIYTGWKFSISDKYEVYRKPNLEMSTSQKYSMVLAFIGTVLTLAKDEAKRLRGKENVFIDEMEEYPLVMDAPLSAFDADKIQKVCHLMLGIAHQLILVLCQDLVQIKRSNFAC